MKFIRVLKAEDVKTKLKEILHTLKTEYVGSYEDRQYAQNHKKEIKKYFPEQNELWLYAGIEINDNHSKNPEGKTKNSGLYYFRDKCNDYEDGMEVQEITHWDDFCNNDYYIEDEYFDNKIIEVLPTEQALKMISKTCATPKNIEYAAINHDLDILWLYDTNGIHWFYEK